jgi:glycosyltransferase involved in cell wall biosynthesis
MHYAVPRILHAAGLLERLYTDIVAPGSAVTSALARLARNDSLRRLMARTPDGIPRRKIVHFPSFAFQCLLRQRAARSATELTAAFLWAGTEFCRRITRRGTGSATAVYTLNSAGLELLDFARRRGLRTVMEQTSPWWTVLCGFAEEERHAWPGWEPDSCQPQLAEEFARREQREWQLADCILCPSEFVRETIKAGGGPAERCRVVPYGVNLPVPVKPRPRHAALHVLFCGAVGLGKGVPYLLEAAKLLPTARFSFRLVGRIQLSRAARAEVSRHMEVRAAVPRPDMPGHYQWADVFVLPTLCEGSATVCYEALASGLPVITTPNAGSVVRDGVDGFLVPIRDSEAIAEKLDLLLSQPELLAEMSRNALQRASEFTLEKYGERLLAALLAR